MGNILCCGLCCGSKERLKRELDEEDQYFEESNVEEAQNRWQMKFGGKVKNSTHEPEEKDVKKVDEIPMLKDE